MWKNVFLIFSVSFLTRFSWPCLQLIYEWSRKGDIKSIFENCFCARKWNIKNIVNLKWENWYDKLGRRLRYTEAIWHQCNFAMFQRPELRFSNFLQRQFFRLGYHNFTKKTHKFTHPVICSLLWLRNEDLGG